MNALIGEPIKDTTNQAWANDTSGFGHKMLLKMGWKQGKGLGKEETGMTEHVKVTKRVDARGLGAELDATGNSGWVETQQSFTGVLQALNAKYGKGKKGGSSSSSDSGGGGDEEDAKSNKKAKRRRKEVAADGGGEESDSERKDAKKKKREKRGEDEDAAKKKKKKKKTAKEKKSEGSSRSTRHRVSRARFIQSKKVSGYSSKDLAAVLGVKE
mmetsp:Transcript_53045/g.120906  ORF Transcript_53045/g.120906 Transcript_53045/m.120906 type:complete len:213 (+) Transcript_53045:147-785(+)|eukprot:CAMPEP_0172609334 /NCGR_PEP_ID=MMETSP1068-20121228/29348_1 /TAXON_ID=35684 /ORGANISM="Pseudopedinella elastica, Strain CCMP716" /LENGTH=212 /DNA_ID=CAMNT_0013412829 /DNA_START=144 /DNA_END=782 /DNA_ORIENTATION=-